MVNLSRHWMNPERRLNFSYDRGAAIRDSGALMRRGHTAAVFYKPEHINPDMRAAVALGMLAIPTALMGVQVYDDAPLGLPPCTKAETKERWRAERELRQLANEMGFPIGD